jgi:hypothetical protein
VVPRTVTFPLRSSDPGFKRLRTVRVKKAGLQVTMEPEPGENLTAAALAGSSPARAGGRAWTSG